MTTKMSNCFFCGEMFPQSMDVCPACGEQFAPPSPEEIFADQIDIEQLIKNGVDSFSHVFLHGIELRGAHLSGVDLFNANLAGADLRSTDLSGANLSSANLSGADLSHAHMTNADLSQADLTGANLTDTNLIAANLTGASYNGLTQWPQDFDPELAGAINMAKSK